METPVTQAMKRIEVGAARGALVAIRDIRKAFPMLTEDTFAKLLWNASRDGIISLHRHDYVSSLNETERAELLNIGDDYYIGANIRIK